MSPRWFDKRTGDHLALDTGGGALARLWATALAGKVDTPYVKATGSSVQINLPKTLGAAARDDARVEGAAVVEHDRARPRARLLRRVRRGDGVRLPSSSALAEVRKGHTKMFQDFEVPDEAIGCGFHEAVRGVLSHHLVIRDKKIANYHPYPPTPWNGSPTDRTARRGRTRTRCRGCRSSRRTGQDELPRRSTSCGRCGASTRACRAACTCTSATARR